MNRVLLVLIALLATLLAAGRIGADQPPAAAELPSAVPVRSTQSVSPAAPVQVVSLDPISPPRTPLIEQMARLESRRRLTLSIRYTYLDSMLVSSDSTLRRWPGREGGPLRVMITRPEQDPRASRLAEQVTVALSAWERRDLGIRFVPADDSLHADIVVTWIDQFPVADGASPEGVRQTGLTSVMANARGELQLARVQLSLGDGRGHPLTDNEIRLVATHEIGHALGLPHSGDRGDIMYPTVLASQVSDRDWATLTLLYTLPPGSLREPSSP